MLTVLSGSFTEVVSDFRVYKDFTQLKKELAFLQLDANSSKQSISNRSLRFSLLTTRPTQA